MLDTMRTAQRELGAAPSSSSRLAGIEGLRGIAAAAILVHHVRLYSSPDGNAISLGQLDRVAHDLPFGVTLFFAISGFLLYRPFAAAIMRAEALPDVGRYLRNRALRVLPAYWVILFATAVLLESVSVREASGELRTGAILDPLELLAQALFLNAYSPRTVVTGIGPAWSLAVEVVFYAALPLLGLLGYALAGAVEHRFGRRVAAFVPVGVMLLVGLSGKFVAAFEVPPIRPYAGWEADWHSVLERSFWCQADLFAFGMALAVLHVDSEDGFLRLPRWWNWAVLVSALVAYAVTAKMTYQSEQLSYSPYNTLMAFACAAVLALVVLPAGRTTGPPRLAAFLERRLFVALGLVSYSVFLWHEPLVRWFRGHGLTLGGETGFVVNLVEVAFATLVASMLTYRWVEAPALRLK